FLRVRLDYFRYCGNPKITARSPSSTHTYRLLVFKEHSQEAPCFHRVAASTAEKRDYEEPFSFRQPVFFSIA
ncbi:hypothetical protein, partial [Paraburkholderia phymatum]